MIQDFTRHLGRLAPPVLWVNTRYQVRATVFTAQVGNIPTWVQSVVMTVRPVYLHLRAMEQLVHRVNQVHTLV